MSELVDALKLEHANIVKILTRVGELGAQTPAGHKALMAAKTGLLAHLEREDQHLYPALREAAKDDAVIGDALEFFIEDIAAVSTHVMAFFEKHAGDRPHEDFAQDFAELVGLLSQRIQKEEAVIYKMYDQL